MDGGPIPFILFGDDPLLGVSFTSNKFPNVFRCLPGEPLGGGEPRRDVTREVTRDATLDAGLAIGLLLRSTANEDL